MDKIQFGSGNGNGHGGTHAAGGLPSVHQGSTAYIKQLLDSELGHGGDQFSHSSGHGGGANQNQLIKLLALGAAAVIGYKALASKAVSTQAGRFAKSVKGLGGKLKPAAETVADKADDAVKTVAAPKGFRATDV